jgi:hypothetical protein
MKTELEEAAERLQKDKYGIFISKDAEVKGQLVIDTAKAAFLSGMTEGAKWQQEQNDTSKVTRVEVIQHSPPYNGRAFTKYNAKDVEIQFQDRGKTLKIFLK